MSRRRSRTSDDAEVTYVEHPRWGSRPRRTGLDVTHIRYGGDAILRWQDSPARGVRVIRGTAVAADLERQSPGTIPVTHYYDLERRCRDCGRLFLFFALEQK